jgi:hypothetical protein
LAIDDRIDRLREVYGPPPINPIERSRWEYRIALIAAAPDVVAELIVARGSGCDEVDGAFGIMASIVVGEVVWRDLQAREAGANTLHAALDVIRTHELCGVALFGWSDERRLALAQHLSRVAVRHTATVFTTSPAYRGLLDDLTW